jgi:hypothetical protein
MIDKMLICYKNRKGSALIWMVFAFTITMIFMTSIIYLTQQDLRETVMQ